MLTRIGRFLVFTDSDDDVIYVDINAIIYIENDLKYITIGTADCEWYIAYKVGIIDKIFDLFDCIQ